MPSHHTRHFGWTIRLLGVVLVALVLLFPIAWMISSALKPRVDLFVVPPQWIPTHPTLSNLAAVVTDRDIQAYAWNSIVVTGLTTLTGTAIAVAAGYSLSRYAFRGRWLILSFLLASQAFPQVMFLIPLFRVWSSLGWLNTPAAIVASQLALILPLAIWIMASFFDRLPREVEEAAVVDGASQFRVLRSVALPLGAPGIVVVALFIVVASWDEYLFTSTIVTEDYGRTLAVGMIAKYIGLYAYEWDSVMAVAVVMALPILGLFLMLQRYFVQGLTAGIGK